jgi:hypothetical protein
MRTADSYHRERLRRSYRPERLHLLFIAESPPASGRFFYRADSGLYRAMREAFQAVDPSITDANFLSTFQSSGHYLVDLCPEPVDRLDAKSRRAECRSAEQSLSKAIGQLRPPIIATVVRSIERNVLTAVSAANWGGNMIHLPYPGRWIQNKEAFLNKIAPIIRIGTPDPVH